MPELPEVETTRRGIAPHLEGRVIRSILVRQPRLRWPVPDAIPALRDQTVQRVDRRAKYLLLELPRQRLVLHLGMSGSLRLVQADTPPGPHDHVDFLLDGHRTLRLNDPRRFGALLHAPLAETHPLLRDLGPEPLSPQFSGAWLRNLSRGRRIAIKPFIMDQKVVVGVGNIYAQEALFRAGIHPARPAGRISAARHERLARAIAGVLGEAIEAGGTTLRDFTGSDGRPGYFRQTLAVYGRQGQPCRTCGRALRHVCQGQRATVYCPRCQR